MASLGSNRIAPLLACLAMASTPVLAQDATTPPGSASDVPATASTDANAATPDTQRRPASRSLFGKAIAELVGSMEDAPRADGRDQGRQADAAAQASRRDGEATTTVPSGRIVAQSDPR